LNWISIIYIQKRADALAPPTFLYMAKVRGELSSLFG
jgi:hypothetical protein